MAVKVALYKVRQWFYDALYKMGGTQVLLTDPRWVAPSIPLSEYGDF